MLCLVHHVVSPWANVRWFSGYLLTQLVDLFFCYITIFWLLVWIFSSSTLEMMHIYAHWSCVLYAPAGVWFLPPGRHGQMWGGAPALSLSCYITPQIAVTWGVEHQTRFNYLPAEPQTLRSPHPPDNFCQILLARQEALDGEGQWSREGEGWEEATVPASPTSGRAQNETIFQSWIYLQFRSFESPEQTWRQENGNLSLWCFIGFEVITFTSRMIVSFISPILSDSPFEWFPFACFLLQWLQFP